MPLPVDIRLIERMRCRMSSWDDDDCPGAKDFNNRLFCRQASEGEALLVVNDGAPITNSPAGLRGLVGHEPRGKLRDIRLNQLPEVCPYFGFRVAVMVVEVQGFEVAAELPANHRQADT